MFLSRSYLLVCLFICWCAWDSYSQASWITYNALDDSFIAEFPIENVKYQSKDIITALGKLQSEVFYTEVDAKTSVNFLYSITRTIYPHGTFHKDSTDLIYEFLEEAAISVSESTGCKELYHDTNEDAQEPFVICRLNDAKTGLAVKAKLFIYKDQLYALQVLTYNDNILNEDIDKFLKGFSLK